MNVLFAASLETPGMRCGAVAPTMPALRAPFRCSPSAGSRPNSLRSNKGEPLSAESCAPQRHRGGARPAPHTGLERRWNHPERAHGVGAHAPGGPLRHRRAAERQADQGSQLFERNEVERVLRDPACREQRRGAAKRPVTSARRGHGPQRRSPPLSNDRANPQGTTK